MTNIETATETIRSAADNSVHAINDLANQAGKETGWRQSVPQPPQEGEPQPAPKSRRSRRDWPCSRRRRLLESHPLRRLDTRRQSRLPGLLPMPRHDPRSLTRVVPV